MKKKNSKIEQFREMREAKPKFILTTTWYVSCKNFTCEVTEKNGIIIESAPILKRWIGQSFYKMCNYWNVDTMSVISSKYEEVD